MDSQKKINKIYDRYLDNLKRNGATSASFALFSANKLVLYSCSDKKWEDFYNNSNEAKHCHIRNHGIVMQKNKINSFSIIWDNLKPNNDESKFLNEQRMKNNRCHGVTIAQTLDDDKLLCVILTGENSNDQFASQVLSQKSKLIEETSNIITLCPLIVTL